MAENIALPDPAESINAYFSHAVNKIGRGCHSKYEVFGHGPDGLPIVDTYEASNAGITYEM